MRKKKYGAWIMGAVASLAISAGITSAYLTASTDTLQNVITAGSVRASLIEEKWQPQDGLTVYPGQQLEKDPAVENTGENDANVFLEVQIPAEMIALVNEETGMKTEKRKTELFAFDPNLEYWELVGREEAEEKVIFVYGYKSTIKPGEITMPLFQQLRTVFYLEGDLDISKNYDVPVIAKVIQANEEEPIAEIYEKYLKQSEEDSKEVL